MGEQAVADKLPEHLKPVKEKRGWPSNSSIPLHGPFPARRISLPRRRRGSRVDTRDDEHEHEQRSTLKQLWIKMKEVIMFAQEERSQGRSFNGSASAETSNPEAAREVRGDKNRYDDDPGHQSSEPEEDESDPTVLIPVEPPKLLTSQRTLNLDEQLSSPVTDGFAKLGRMILWQFDESMRETPAWMWVLCLVCLPVTLIVLPVYHLGRLLHHFALLLHGMVPHNGFDFVEDCVDYAVHLWRRFVAGENRQQVALATGILLRSVRRERPHFD